MTLLLALVDQMTCVQGEVVVLEEEEGEEAFLFFDFFTPPCHNFLVLPAWKKRQKTILKRTNTINCFRKETIDNIFTVKVGHLLVPLGCT